MSREQNAASFWLPIMIGVLLLGVRLLPLQAQTYIFGTATFAIGNAPSSIATADFNHDGVMDLVLSNVSDDTISVLLGEHGGTFQPQVLYPAGHSPVSVVIGDFNDDGNVDVAVLNANCTSDRLGQVCANGWVSVLLGNGDGTFLPAVNYAVGSAGGPATLQAADLNGDGKLDLAATNGMDKTVSVLLNNGHGAFQAQVVYSVLNGAIGLAFADFTGDHKLDIAVTGNSMSVLPGNGDGTFQPAIASGTAGAALAVGDFNHDGKLDVATTYTPGALAIMLGNGDGTFTPTGTYPAAASVYTADLNGDGNVDLLLFGPNYGFSVELGRGDGTFRAPVRYADGDTVALTADVNGDGKLDVITCGSTTFLSILLGLGDGTFVTYTDYYSGSYGLVSADFNGDQKPDLAAITHQNVDVILNHGDGTFGASIVSNLGHLATQMIAGDFNHDGRPDVATVFSNCDSGCQPGSAAVLLGNGDGTFQPPQLATVGLQPNSLAAGDFNHDGNLDLVVANQTSNTISVLLGNGNGSFQPRVDYAIAPSPTIGAVGDLNRDGNSDIVVSYSGGFSIFFGNSDGTFGARVDHPGIWGPVIIDDFNGDGIPDLCFPNGQIVVLLGNGDGTFQPPLSSSYAGSYGTAIDFNGDHKLDVIGGNQVSAFIALGNGDGTFQSPTGYVASDGYMLGLAALDLNSDGVPDIASLSGTTNRFSVLLSIPFKGVSASALNFGSQGTGTQSAPQAVRITNISNVKFNVLHILTTPPFSQTNDCGASLDAGAYCTISVVFSPAVTGQQSGSLILTDSTRSSPTTISLSGTGVSGPFLEPSPSSLTFSPLDVGSSSNPLPVALRNSGNATVTISAIGITGQNSSDYSQTNDCPSSLPPGESCIANVTFAPTAGGVRAANLSVTDNAAGSPQTVPLTGDGLALLNFLTITVSGNGGHVTSLDGFINCPGVCSHAYPANTQVTLNPRADPYWSFTSWTGNCAGKQSCVVTMTQDLSAIATFRYAYSGLQFVPVTPCRVMDTRWPGGEFGGPALRAGDSRTYFMEDSGCGIPQQVGAYSLNITVIPHGYLGYLTIYPYGQPVPSSSTMNSLDGRIKADAVIVAGGQQSALNVYVTDTTDAVIDINGYFPDYGGEVGFYPLPPCRVVDTRNGTGDLQGPFLQGGVERDFPLLESSCLPPGVSPQAYSLNITAVPHPQGKALSYLTVWPQGQTRPMVSTLNNPTATVVANAALVQAGPTGAIATYPSDDTDLVIDINGYFSTYQAGALLFYPLAPCRVLDTRQGAGAFTGLLNPPVDVGGTGCGADSTAQAYVFNATVVPAPSLSYLTLWPDGQNQPVVSTLNAADGWVTSNMAIVPTTNGAIDAYASGMTQLILDISGYFAP